MTSAPALDIQNSTSRVIAVEASRTTLRLRLKPRAATTGFVDGGWWPRSRDLAAELPRLVTVLSVRLGPIERVSFHLADWGPTIGKINVGGEVVRLAGYRSQHPDTVDVIAARHRVTLLVVPPDAAAQTAHAALIAAGQRGNTDDVDALLRSSSFTMHVLDSIGGEAEAARQRWELDGGPVYVNG